MRARNVARRWTRATTRFLLGAGLTILPASSASAQALDVVHTFLGQSGTTGADAGVPKASLIQATDGNFYGTTTSPGVVFRMTPTGVVTIVARFPTPLTQSVAPLLQASDGSFFGVSYSYALVPTGMPGTFQGGGMEAFRLDANDVLTDLIETSPSAPPTGGMIQAADGRIYVAFAQTGIADIERFSASGVLLPGAQLPILPKTIVGVGSMSTLVQAPSGDFYGTSSRGGAFDQGTVYRWNPSGAFAVVHDFAGGADGALPNSIILGADGNFYGTTEAGGTANVGTVFQLTPAGTVTILHSFTGGSGDGAAPTAGLIQAADQDFYGTTPAGGAANQGIAFKIAADGTFTVLHSFADGPGDGAQPQAALLQAADGNFYGTTALGGTAYIGTAFRMTASGTVTILHSFDAYDGAVPDAPLTVAPPASPRFFIETLSGGAFNGGTITAMTLSGAVSTIHHFADGTGDGVHPGGGLLFVPDPVQPLQTGTLVGTTEDGGAAGVGTVFSMNLDGGNYQVLHSFAGGSNDGGGPSGALLQWFDGSAPAGYSFLGTTRNGGSSGVGTIFRLAVDNTVTILHSFTGSATDGRAPEAGLILATDGNFYGTTSLGGAFGLGTIFRMTPAGNVSLLYSFSGGSDGSTPFGALVQANDGNLYGTTTGCCIGNSRGAVFRVTLSGAFTRLHTFTDGTDGASPQAGLIQAADGFLYGTTVLGGAYSAGTLFRVSLGGDLTTVATFPGWPLTAPAASLVEYPTGVLWGTTASAGIVFASGAVFRLTLSASPGAPSVLTAAARNLQVQLAWSPVPTASSYTVKRALSSGGETLLASGVTTSSYLDATVLRHQTYHYIVTAVNASGESVASYEVSVTPGRSVVGDFDGDWKTDMTVFTPSTGYWTTIRSGGGTWVQYRWGGSIDIPVPGDYDGDGRTDLAVFRPSTGMWYILQSSSNWGVQYNWGSPIDVPVPGDYDGDGKTDPAVFRPSTGVWYLYQSATKTGMQYTWGGSLDTPVPGDYDDDGKTDVAVFRPSTGAWYILQSSTLSLVQYTWGGSIDTPVPGDYDGDGKTDVAVFRPSTGAWYILQSGTFAGVQYTWGGGVDVPVPGDYDGDGRTDVAVFRPSTGMWYILQSGRFAGVTYTLGAGAYPPWPKIP